ncbi:aminotransferase class I/II-fold pyridoxal phosphate-dependent enzyme [Curvivirga aplysinae]|uniref:aminotransferase class I/II-fold pyridoxal phosphate-dependent enzyme n=1 Tax=Curvivirga aplysinae TaxID=2529852 RepID=UPI0012BBA7CB|nr:aminotransferase class I/II-fold pyridoxal phosphate-dependent enzyme [Curvivirga aplysinae]MTI11380.1 aminotransferase class I/II-fold pyridoxal phosphate-dependent enzyme [Curvivirga aplysinae]
MIPLSVPDLSEAEELAVMACVRSSWVSSAGPEIEAFEKEIAEYCGRQFAIATCSGTAALQLMLTCAGIGQGDKVILPTYCFVATVNAILHVGGEPIFVDITRQNWVLDPDLVEKALKLNKDVKAVIAVDVLNNFPDFYLLNEICQNYNVKVFEDAAGALGAKSPAGDGGSFGEASIFSFNGNKVLTTGGGGMIVTDNEDLAKHAKFLCAQARIGTDYIHSEVGFNYRMPNLNAALGRAQFGRLEGMISKRRKIMSDFSECVENMTECELQPFSKDIESNGWLTSLIFEDEDLLDKFISYMTDNAVMVRKFWQPLHHQAPYKQFETYTNGSAKYLSHRVVTLPCSSNMPLDDIAKICNLLRNWKI